MEKINYIDDDDDDEDDYISEKSFVLLSTKEYNLLPLSTSTASHRQQQPRQRQRRQRQRRILNLKFRDISHHYPLIIILSLYLCLLIFIGSFRNSTWTFTTTTFTKGSQMIQSFISPDGGIDHEFIPSMNSIIDQCSSIPSIPIQSYINRRKTLSQILNSNSNSKHTISKSNQINDIFITEPNPTSSYYTKIDQFNWNLSERVFLIGITSRLNQDGVIETLVMVLTPRFEADRARLLVIPGLLNDGSVVGGGDEGGGEGGGGERGTNESLVFVEWEESESPIEVFVRYLSQLSSPIPHDNAVETETETETETKTKTKTKTKRTIHIDPYTRSFIFDSFNQVIQMKSSTSKEKVDWDVKIASGDVLVRERKSEEEIELLRCANQVSGFVWFGPPPPPGGPLFLRLLLYGKQTDCPPPTPTPSFFCLFPFGPKTYSSRWKLSKLLVLECHLGSKNQKQERY